MENNINKYHNKIYRGLRLPKAIKRQIKKDLASEIYLRIENEYFLLKKAKVVALIIWSVIAAAMVVLIVYSLITVIYPQWALPPVFGGASGNKAIFIAYKWSFEEWVLGLSIKAIIFVFSFLQILRNIKFLIKKEGM